MLDSGFMPLVIMGSDRNPYGARCAVATREKTAVFYSRVVLPFTLHTVLNAIVCCLQLNTGGCRGCNPEGRLLVIDAVGWRSMYLVVMPAYLFISLCSHHSKFMPVCQLPICNLFTQHAYLLWRDTTSEPMAPGPISSLLQFPTSSLLYFLQAPFSHSILLILCFQQKPVSLTTSLKTVGAKCCVCLCAGLHVANTGGWRHTS